MSSLEKETIELKTQINIHKAIEKIQTERLDAIKAYKEKIEAIAKKSKNQQLKQIIEGVCISLEDCLKIGGDQKNAN